MFSVFKKEVTSFFSSLIGYVAIIVFLLATGLFLWVFPGDDYNILNYGYATLEGLFDLAPWVFMFLIPAITMRSFSEEIKSGTLEILTTRPLSEVQIILGKYFAAMFLVAFSLIPTVVYYITVYELGITKGNIDSGVVVGSYLGLLLLAGSFAAIGIFASSLTSNQIVAFMLAVFLCFFCYFAFVSLSQLGLFVGKIDNIIQSIGINAHYLSIRRGVIDTRDVIYFLSFISIFILLTKTSLESRKW
jgi:ABC-2 type transport system permease protein